MPSPSPPTNEPSDAPTDEPSDAPAAEAAKVTTAVIVAGDTSDYTPTVQDALRAGVAAEAGVETDNVTLSVEAASVLLTFEIVFPADAATDATTATTALAAQLADPETASTFFNTAIVDAGVTNFTIAVESIAIEPTTEAEPESTSKLSAGAIAGIVIGVLVGVALLVGVFVKLKNRGLPSSSSKPTGLSTGTDEITLKQTADRKQDLQKQVKEMKVTLKQTADRKQYLQKQVNEMKVNV